MTIVANIPWAFSVLKLVKTDPSHLLKRVSLLLMGLETESRTFQSCGMMESLG